MGGLHEEAGFDRLLVDCPAGSADPVAVANQVLTTTSGLGVLLAHRPGSVAPTIAARQFATLEAFHPGRVAMLVMADGDAAEQRPGRAAEGFRCTWAGSRPARSRPGPGTRTCTRCGTSRRRRWPGGWRRSGPRRRRTGGRHGSAPASGRRPLARGRWPGRWWTA